MDKCELTIENVWRLCQPLLAAKLGDSAFNMWLGEKSGARAVELNDSQLVLELPKGSFISWVEENYLPTIEDVLEQVTCSRRKVLIRESQSAPLPAMQAAPAAVASQQQSDKGDSASTGLSAENRKLLSRLNKLYTFDRFIVGETNKFAYNTCRTVAINPGKICNPLFLHAPSGLGKTHLLQAIAHQAMETNPNVRIEYLTAENFSNLYVECAMQNESQSRSAFRNRFRNVDILLIDDVQFFTGRTKTQEEFYYTFNALFESGKQIVLTSDRVPQDIPDIHERLVSRFEWGATVDISRPDLPTRLAILNQKQIEFDEKFTDDVLNYIARHITSNVRYLECSLITLKTYMAMSSSMPTMKLTHADLDHLLAKLFDTDLDDQVTIARILEYVARHFDVKIQDIKGKSRIASLTTPRQIAMFLARKLTDNSLPAIADGFNKTHPTVLHAIETVEKKIAESESFREDVSAISRAICRN